MYNRVAEDTDKRVVGVLLGSSFKGTVDVSTNTQVFKEPIFFFSVFVCSLFFDEYLKILEYFLIKIQI